MATNHIHRHRHRHSPSRLHDRTHDRSHDCTRRRRSRSPSPQYSGRKNSDRRRSRSRSSRGPSTQSRYHRSPSPGRRRDRSPHERDRKRGNSHSRSRSRSRSLSHGRSYSQSYHSHSPLLNPTRVSSPSYSFNSPVSQNGHSPDTITGELANDFKRMTYDTMHGRLLLNKGQIGRFEITQPSLNLNQQELLHRVIWYEPPEPMNGIDMTKSENDEAYLKSTAIPILSRVGLVYASIQWIAVERNYLLPNCLFNVVIQLSPIPGVQFSPGLLIYRLNERGLLSRAETFNQHQLVVCSTKYNEPQRLCLFYFKTTPTRGVMRGCVAGQNCPSSHQHAQAKRIIEQLLRDAGAPMSTSTCHPYKAPQPTAEATSSIGSRMDERSRADDLQLMTYDTMKGRLVLATSQFESLEPTVNRNHHELLFRVVCSQPPTPLNNMDMTNPDNDESYLRGRFVPHLTRLFHFSDEISWLAIDRTFLLPGSTFNVMIQFHSSATENSFPPSRLIAKLNGVGYKSETFNYFQLIYLSSYSAQLRQKFCRFYFEITPSRQKQRGCHSNSQCGQSYQLQLFTAAIQLMLHEKGAPIDKPEINVTTNESKPLDQPDIELETVEQFKGALKLWPGGTSIDHTTYDPHITIATRDSEAIIHRLVWTDPIDPPPLDALTRDEARADDLRQIWGQLTTGNMIRFDEIDWITRIYSYEGRPTKFILIQCSLQTNVAQPLSNWNRNWKSHFPDPPLKCFIEWWFRQRLTVNLYPDLSRSICYKRWILLRLSDGRLVNNCHNNKTKCRDQQPCRFSHEPQLMIDFIQRERAVAIAAAHQTHSQHVPFIDSSAHQPMELFDSSLNHLAMSSISSQLITSQSPTPIRPEPQTSTANSSPISISPGSIASTNDFNVPSDSSDSERPTSTPVLPSSSASHPYLSSYPVGSVLINTYLLPTNQVIRQPPTIPFTLDVNSEFNLYIPTDGLFHPAFRSEWSRTGDLSDKSRIEDAQICLVKLKELRLLTADMDLLMVHRHIDLSAGTPTFQLLCHFRSHASLMKLQVRFQAMHEGRPLEQ